MHAVQVFEGVCRPLKVRVEQLLLSGPSLLLCFHITQLLTFYASTLRALLATAGKPDAAAEPAGVEHEDEGGGAAGRAQDGALLATVLQVCSLPPSCALPGSCVAHAASLTSHIHSVLLHTASQ